MRIAVLHGRLRWGGRLHQGGVRKAVNARQGRVRLCGELSGLRSRNVKASRQRHQPGLHHGGHRRRDLAAAGQVPNWRDKAEGWRDARVVRPSSRPLKHVVGVPPKKGDIEYSAVGGARLKALGSRRRVLLGSHPTRRPGKRACSGAGRWPAFSHSASSGMRGVLLLPRANASPRTAQRDQRQAACGVVQPAIDGAA